MFVVSVISSLQQSAAGRLPTELTRDFHVSGHLIDVLLRNEQQSSVVCLVDVPGGCH